MDRDLARQIIAADMASGDTRYSIRTINHMLVVMEDTTFYTDDVEGLLGDIRSRYSGGPNGPFTMDGSMIDGVLLTLASVFGATFGKVSPGHLADDYEEWLLTNYIPQ